MAFNGTLLKVGGRTVPLKYILLDTYQATPNQRQDINSYRDLKQDLHRTVAENYKSVVKFRTRSLNEEKMRDLMDNYITAGFSDVKERKAPLEFYDPETGGYYSGNYYLVQPSFKIRKVDPEKNDIRYEPMDLEFIQY